MSIFTFHFLLIFCFVAEARVKPYRTTVVTPEEIQTEYDFIIVGGGSAGTLLASRLSEVSCWKILLVEAGEDENYLSDVPAISLFLQSSHFNWKFKNRPQSCACLGYKNRQCNAPTGKVLGGTGVIGDMVYTRGHKKDYDLWASMGNPGWSYEEILPYFLKSERMKIPEYRNSTFHNTKGELYVDRQPFTTNLSQTFLEGGKELGYEVIDYNSGDNIGFSRLQVNMIRGTRCSGNRAFLSKASKRENLDVVILAQVTKILIDEDNRAKAIQFTKKNQTYTVSSRLEIILTAGVYNTPKLLILSGIGPKSHLSNLSIPLISDLPVGNIIRDHYGFIGTMFKINSSEGVTINEIANINTLLKYFEGDGYLTGAYSDGIAFVRTKYATDERPDLALVFVPNAVAVPPGMRVLGFSGKYLKNFFKEPITEKWIWSLAAFLLRPKSVGSFRLRSNDPFDDPVIDANFFKDDMDVKVLVEGVKMGMRLSETKAFQKFGSELIDKKIPGCENFDIETDEYWECYVRYLTIEVHHQTSTSQMGPETDPNAVVDHELRVHGIKNLRIADLSVVPLHISGHTNAAAYMIAEKAADMIVKYWTVTTKR